MEKLYSNLLRKSITVILTIIFIFITEFIVSISIGSIPLIYKIIGKIIELLLVGYTINCIVDAWPIIFKYLKKDFSIEILHLFLYELILAFILITSSVTLKQRTYFMIYLPIFWFSSGLMRVIIEATKFQFEENLNNVEDFYKKFAMVRLTFFFMMAYLYIITYPEEYINLLIAFIIIYSIILLFYRHPVFIYLLNDDRLELEIKIIRTLYEEKANFKRLLNLSRLNNREYLLKILRNLKWRGIIKKENKNWKLNLRFIKPKY